MKRIFQQGMTLTRDIEPAVMPKDNQSPTVIPIVYALGEAREYRGEDAKKRRAEIQQERAEQ